MSKILLNGTVPAAYYSNPVGFRDWVQKMHDLFAAIDLVQTSDTGQIDIPSASPTLTNSGIYGYEMYRFDDELQSTNPIFVKVEYGSRVGSAHGPYMRFTVGTGTDGAGTITGLYLTNWSNSNTSWNTNQAVAQASSAAACSDGSGFVLINGLDTAYSAGGLVLIERPRLVSTGLPTSGLVVYSNPFGNPQGRYYSGPGASPGFFYPYMGFSIPNSSTIFPVGSDRFLTPLSVVVPETNTPRLTSNLLLIGVTGDIGAYGEQSITHLGVESTYMSLGAKIGSFDVSGQPYTAGFLRWED